MQVYFTCYVFTNNIKHLGEKKTRKKINFLRLYTYLARSKILASINKNVQRYKDYQGQLACVNIEIRESTGRAVGTHLKLVLREKVPLHWIVYETTIRAIDTR